MKVITQLVKHFWERGALSMSEAEYLVRHGFIRERDLPGYVAPSDEHPAEPTWVEPVVEPLTPLELVEESLVRRRGRRGSGAAKQKTLEPKELCARVEMELARREGALAKVVRMAAGSGSARDWQEAAQALRQAPAKMHEQLVRSLRDGRLTLRDAWLALDLEPFHRLLSDEELRGRAARAYVALLVSDQGAALGKYTWILQHDEMQAVSNLRFAYRALLAALERMYRHNLRPLTKALNQGADPVLVWGLVLLHNAHRARLNPKDSRAVPDYGPVQPPEPAVWQNAWTAALGMDRRRLTEFLVLCYQFERTRDARHPDHITRELYCPNGWHLPD